MFVRASTLVHAAFLASSSNWVMVDIGRRDLISSAILVVAGGNVLWCLSVR